MTNQTIPKRAPKSDCGGLDYEKIGAVVGQVMAAVTQSEASPTDDKQAALRSDYQITVDVIKLLSDIRFRCLVFVTAVITVANALLPGTGESATRITLGFVGFLSTLGIAVYELRNSQLYEAAIHRAKVLESKLKTPRSSEQSKKAGLFNERPPYVEKHYWKGLDPDEREDLLRDGNARWMSFWFVKVKHDRGLALIYGAALGGWIYLIADGLFSLPAPQRFWPPAPEGWTRIIAAVLAVGAFALSSGWFIYHDEKRFRPSAPVENPLVEQ